MSEQKSIIEDWVIWFRVRISRFRIFWHVIMRSTNLPSASDEQMAPADAMMSMVDGAGSKGDNNTSEEATRYYPTE